MEKLEFQNKDPIYYSVGENPDFDFNQQCRADEAAKNIPHTFVLLTQFIHEDQDDCRRNLGDLLNCLWLLAGYSSISGI
jgi:hypothetical protein